LPFLWSNVYLPQLLMTAFPLINFTASIYRDVYELLLHR
jgi:hypothetical protein